MYWPARKRKVSLAGSFSISTITSSAARTMLCTRQGSFLIGMSVMRRTSRTSSTRSEVGLAQQNSAKPVSRSATDKVVSGDLP